MQQTSEHKSFTNDDEAAGNKNTGPTESEEDNFYDNIIYDFFIIDARHGSHRGNHGIKFTFGCVQNRATIREFLPHNTPIEGSRLHKFMKILGYQDVKGVEPNPETFIRRSMPFKAKVFLLYSEGAKESQRYRINFETLMSGGRISATYTEQQMKELKEFVGDITTKNGIVMKLRSLSFERVCLYCDMIRDNVVNLQ